MVGNKWRKAKLALGCIQLPRTLDDENNSSSSAAVLTAANGGHRRQFSDVAVSLSSSTASAAAADCRPASPITPTPSSSGLRFSRNSSKSSKSSKQKTCAICLSTVIPGQGHAIFTAECSHTFHFNCITSNVNHGNHICPICRAKWTEIPFQGQTPEALRGKLRANSVNGSRDYPAVPASQQPPLPQPDFNQNISPTYRVTEPAMFDDDDLIDEQHTLRELPAHNASDDSSIKRVEIKTCPEVSSIAKLSTYDNFSVLIHLKAPVAEINYYGASSPSQNSRAPVDLVTVLDVSGSMAGTKLALLKRAMGFVIHHLGPHDRLSVIVFSSSARLFPLKKMSDIGRNQALQAVNSLSSNGGTNIAEGLKKGAKVMLERRCKNPVSSMILLSDGQDTYTVNGPSGAQSRTDYKSLLPNCIQQNSGSSFQIPVHTFGFGSDHDSVSMHSISEGSGGTFSFIETEGVIQDAFAQCMGGLLSVVVQELELKLNCVYPNLQLGSIKAGSYHTGLLDNARTGFINVGDLYAEEERDFLVTMNIPKASVSEMPLLKVSCTYKDPITKEMTRLDEVEGVKINRPERAEHVEVSMEVDKQRNRLRAADAMSEARAAAESGDLVGAVSILESCRETLSESVSAHDPLCVGLLNELKEMKDRMSTRQVYEASGRAYVLSGLSSHSWQRATVRLDSTSSTNLSQAYQTSFMADMISRSQTLVFPNFLPSPPVRPPRSLSGPSPR